MSRTCTNDSPQQSPSASHRVEIAPCVLQLKPLVGWGVLVLCVELLGLGLVQHQALLYDFRAFYSAGRLLTSLPSQLYDLNAQRAVQNAFVSPTSIVVPFYHPSYEALLYAPFAFLSYRAAYLCFMAVELLLLGIAAWLAPSPACADIQHWSRATMFFLYMPALDAILQGQDSLALLVLILLSLRSVQTDSDLTGGCLLAMGLFRPQIVIPMALLIGLRRGRRFFRGFLITGVCVAMTSALLVRPSGMIQFLHLLSRASLVNDSSTRAQNLIAAFPHSMPNLYGMLYIVGVRLLSPRIGSLVVLISSALLVGICIFRSCRTASVEFIFSIAILASVLVSYHLYLYDLTLLLVPFLLLSGRLHKYLVLALYAFPFLLVFLGFGDWISVIAPILLVMLFQAREPCSKELPLPL